MSWDELPEETRVALDQERDAIERHITRYIQIINQERFEDDPPIIQEWVVGAEWTNIQYEREARGGRDSILRDGATLSAGLGLAVYLRDRFGG